MKQSKLRSIFDEDEEIESPNLLNPNNSYNGPSLTPTHSTEQLFPDDDNDNSLYMGPNPSLYNVTTPQVNPGSPQNTETDLPIVDEVPLLEELGIDFGFVVRKSFSVLNPWSSARRKLRAYIQSSDSEMVQETSFMQDEDLIGPIFFGLLLGTALLLKGEIEYGSIYSCGGIGCILMWLLFNLMAQKGIWLSILKTVSVLGYSLLPVIFLAFLETILFWIFRDKGRWRGVFKLLASALVVVWSTTGATEMFVANLKMKNKNLVVAYPIGLLFSIFIILVI